MQGGGVSEPLVDMVRLLASLNDANGRVQIPKFLEDVRILGEEESKLIDAIIERCDKSVSRSSRCRGDADVAGIRREQSEKLRKHSHIADIRSSLVSRHVYISLSSSPISDHCRRRWRQPALSIHNVEVTDPSKTLIPSSTTATVSIRIVPDQSLQVIVEQLKAHLHKSFAGLRTCNQLSVRLFPLDSW